VAAGGDDGLILELSAAAQVVAAQLEVHIRCARLGVARRA
jgi:hypothetical protein